jgi:hypothetical protein
MPVILLTFFSCLQIGTKILIVREFLNTEDIQKLKENVWHPDSKICKKDHASVFWGERLAVHMPFFFKDEWQSNDLQR